MVPIIDDSRETRNVVVGKFANNNNLTLDDELAVYGYRDFETLDFKSCNIEEVVKHVFKGLANLKKLDLSSNHISRIEVGSFEDLKRLEKLKLSFNKLITLDHRSLTGLSNLMTLDLSNNLLSVFMIPGLYREEKGNQALEKLSQISLEGNPWRCDCQLGPLHRDLTARGLLEENVKCSHETGGRPWTEIASKNFTCSPYPSPMSPTQKVQIGENLTLECEYQGYPRPSMFWKAGGEVLKENVKVFRLENRSTEFLDVVRSSVTLSDLKVPDIEDVKCCAVNIKGQHCQTVFSALQHNTLGATVRSISLTFSNLVLGWSLPRRAVADHDLTGEL